MHGLSRFGELPRVIFSQGIEGKYIVPRENITILAPPTRDISSVPVDICYILDGQNESTFCVLYDYHKVWYQD